MLASKLQLTKLMVLANTNSDNVRHQETCRAGCLWSPQGLILSTLLNSLYTYGCVDISNSTIIVKFAHDTVVVGLISDNDKKVYLEASKKPEKWCKENDFS